MRSLFAVNAYKRVCIPCTICIVIRIIARPLGLHFNKLFVAFPWVVTSTGPGGFMVVCVYFMTGTPEGSTESGAMEKPRIEPATHGLQNKQFFWLSWV